MGICNARPEKKIYQEHEIDGRKGSSQKDSDMDDL